jgi:hypothetical protein
MVLASEAYKRGKPTPPRTHVPVAQVANAADELQRLIMGVVYATEVLLPLRKISGNVNARAAGTHVPRARYRSVSFDNSVLA